MANVHPHEWDPFVADGSGTRRYRGRVFWASVRRARRTGVAADGTRRQWDRPLL